MENNNITLDEMLRRVELFKNSKNPIIQKIVALAEKKVKEMEAAKNKEE